jgi:signal recognition particle GTPase
MSATSACLVSTVLPTVKEESNFSREAMAKMLPALPKRPSPMVCRRSNNPSSIRLTPLVAKENSFDVVLIDTAGRMQDNEPLMRALAKVGLQYR